MARRSTRPRSLDPKGVGTPAPLASPTDEPASPREEFWTPFRLTLAVVALLVIPWSLALLSLVRENPTIDEVVHLPAGVTYWQQGTFKLYPHNPPLFKLIAALPVVAAQPEMRRVYNWPPGQPFWQGRSPNKAGIAHLFQEDNAERYFELFTRARVLMPTFAMIGGVVVFLWSRRLYGPWGGLLSLLLWGFCPNILAHTRLVTSDVAATSLGFTATYLFWRYLKKPTWARATLAGIVLGLAELSKFSMLLLYGLWPAIWLMDALLTWNRTALVRRLARATFQGLAMVALSVVVIDAGYGFEGVGHPLGRFPFVSQSLTVARTRPQYHMPRPASGDLLNRIREYRVNRFQGTPFTSLPIPLPYYYLSGFDEQKLEADGVWLRFLTQSLEESDQMGAAGERLASYPVYLDGQLQSQSWWHYYLFTLLYKVPEGTWALVIAAAALNVLTRRSRASWADEFAVGLVPAVTLLVMSLGTNINLGLRYVLPIFPYVFVAVGKLAPWCLDLAGRRRWWAVTVVGLCLGETALATVLTHPHYLAYFNWASGGSRRGSEHLIDSNLDWGQDLINLHSWVREHAPDEPIGLAYFGQIHPDIFLRRAQPIDWYLPPVPPGRIDGPPPSHRPSRPGARLSPGLYAVSASLMRGLDWRVYDRSYTPGEKTRGWAPWSASRDAFSYFQRLEPFERIGGSIFLYRLTEDDVRRLQPLFGEPAPIPSP